MLFKRSTLISFTFPLTPFSCPALPLPCNLPSVLQHRVQSAHPHPVAPLVLARIQVQNKTQSAVEFLKDNATACHVHVQPAVGPRQHQLGGGGVWHMQQHVDCTSFDSQLTVIKDYLGHCQAPWISENAKQAQSRSGWKKGGQGIISHLRLHSSGAHCTCCRALAKDAGRMICMGYACARCMLNTCGPAHLKRVQSRRKIALHINCEWHVN